VNESASLPHFQPRYIRVCSPSQGCAALASSAMCAKEGAKTRRCVIWKDLCDDTNSSRAQQRTAFGRPSRWPRNVQGRPQQRWRRQGRCAKLLRVICPCSCDCDRVLGSGVFGCGPWGRAGATRRVLYYCPVDCSLQQRLLKSLSRTSSQRPPP